MRDVKLLKERGMMSSSSGIPSRRPLGLFVMAVGIFGFGFVVGAATGGNEEIRPQQASLDTLDAETKVLTKVSSAVDAAPKKVAALNAQASHLDAPEETQASADEHIVVANRQADMKPEVSEAKMLDQALAGLQEELLPEDHVFTVQVSSFPTTEEASAFARQLERKGFEPYITAADIPGRGTWHRVRVGNYTTKGDAESLRSRLAAVDVAGLVLKAR